MSVEHEEVVYLKPDHYSNIHSITYAAKHHIPVRIIRKPGQMISGEILWTDEQWMDFLKTGTNEQLHRMTNWSFNESWFVDNSDDGMLDSLL